MKLVQLRFHWLITGIISLFVGLILNIPLSEAAFGTSPPWVNNDHMLPGTTFEQVINLSRSNTGKAVKANLNINGDEKLLKWITVENKEELVMEKGQAILPMKVLVTVPKRAELRNYKASIFITMEDLTPAELGGGQVGIAVGGNVVVDITVTGEELRDYRVASATNDPIEEGNPLSIKIRVQNLGNTSINEIEGKIEVYDEEEKILVQSLDYLPLDDVVPPDETNIVRVIFEDALLNPGQYWLHVEASKDGEVLYSERLRQVITENATPLVESEDLSEKPALPKIPEAQVEEVIEQVEEIEVVEAGLRPVASTSETNVFLIFGLAGLGFALIAILGVVIVLIFVLKNQQKPAMGNYPMMIVQQPMPSQLPSAPQAAQSTQVTQPPQPGQPLQQQTVQNSSESSNMNLHGENQQ